MSMVCSASHACHAFLDTLSKTASPAGPGKGGRSRPSSSSSNLRQNTMRVIWCSLLYQMRWWKSVAQPRLKAAELLEEFFNWGGKPEFAGGVSVYPALWRVGNLLGFFHSHHYGLNI